MDDKLVIQQVLNLMGMIPAGLARKTGISETSICRWKQGKQKIGRGYLYILYHHCSENDMVRHLLLPLLKETL